MAGLASADVSHDFLEGPFETGPDVTQRCISCHAGEAEDILNSSHWLWSGCAACTCAEGSEFDEEMGKRMEINNFCVAVPSNEPRCTSCHIGYGWEDKTFDFTDASGIDCLVCHDGTGTYKKIPTGAGAPFPEVDLVAVARSVDTPTRATCGDNCHFYGGGGDNVKHGDMSTALSEPSPELDVHMGGGDFDCQVCHETHDHNIAGRSSSPLGTQCRVLCSDCHTNTPHTGSSKERLDSHSESIACQTCHIPQVAQGVPTKMYWDWSEAGQDIADIPVDEYGKETYNKKKGSFVWEMNITPTYAWYNGEFEKYHPGDLIDPDELNTISAPVGDIDDPMSKIYPFKVHTAMQISDAEYKYLIVPDLFGGEDAYWTAYDWDKAAAAGMEYIGLPYSGEYEFVETELYLSLNHEVAPAQNALECMDCHSEQGSFDFEALGYEGDPMMLGISRFDEAAPESEDAGADTGQDTPGFEIFLAMIGLSAAFVLLRRND